MTATIVIHGIPEGCHEFSCISPPLTSHSAAALLYCRFSRDVLMLPDTEEVLCSRSDISSCSLDKVDTEERNPELDMHFFDFYVLKKINVNIIIMIRQKAGG